MLKRQNEIKVRFGDEEYEALMGKVRLSGLSREEFIRRTLAQKRVVELPPVDYGRLVFEMRRAGQNLHRLLVIATANHFFEAADIQDCLNEIKAVERKIHSSFFAPQKED